MLWRWDQGRMIYFSFDIITKIAPVLLKYNGADIKAVDPQFRKDLMDATGLPFAPSTYSVKRNYKRVFECMMLASFINQRLIISDIGRAIANNSIQVSNVDGYLYEIERRFRYPYPAFNNYTNVKGICFPFLAIIKLLLAHYIPERLFPTGITLEDIGAYLIANDVSGLEDLDFYQSLKPIENFSFDSYGSNDQKRQVREMMHFIAQHSYIDMHDKYLTIEGLSEAECIEVFNSLKPVSTEVTSQTPIDDFLKITAFQPQIGGEYEGLSDLEEFTVKEGKRVFKSHFQYERNGQLRKEYIKMHPKPICDVCGKNMQIIYPWTVNMLEIHHVHPLSSHEDTSGNHTTSLSDVVGICPSCHRAMHLYYKKYLLETNKSDFSSNSEAEAVYNEAKKIVKGNNEA